jgi:hypothetical protein
MNSNFLWGPINENAGKPPKQAVAIAYSVKREAAKKKKGK